MWNYVDLWCVCPLSFRQASRSASPTGMWPLEPTSLDDTQKCRESTLATETPRGDAEADAETDAELTAALTYYSS